MPDGYTLVGSTPSVADGDGRRLCGRHGFIEDREASIGMTLQLG